MNREAERWFREANWDIETAKILHERGRYNASSFYAHQAGEKAVKALLYFVNESPWGHSIREMLERFFESVGERDEKLLTHARELDRHYIPSRYPDAHPSGTPHEAYDAKLLREPSKRLRRCWNMQEKFWLRKEVEKVRERWKVHAAILFGSRARGDFKPWSDYDLLIIAYFKEKYLDRIGRLLEILDSKIEPHPYTLEESFEMLRRGNPTIVDALAEGVVIFEGEGLERLRELYKDLVRRGLKKSNVSVVLPKD